VLGIAFHFTHLKSGSVPLMTTMHVMEAFCPSSTLLFLGEPHFRIGLVRDFSVKKKKKKKNRKDIPFIPFWMNNLNLKMFGLNG